MKKHSLFLLSIILLSVPHLAAAEHFKSGLIQPSEAEMAAFDEKYGLPPVPLAVPLPSRVVNSTYLPPVANGNQGQVGICGSICITYFTATHQLAKARGWSWPGHNGDWSKVTSPAWGVWAYRHNTKGGVPWGANPFETIEEIIRAGIRSWADYPYTGTALDVSYMPSFNERAAALRWRAKTAVSIGGIHSESGIHSLKYFLAQGNIAATATPYVDTLRNYSGANVQANGVVIEKGAADRLGHALTIVGYDDNMPYIDPQTGATKQGAFLVVNSWGTSWGYSVPEVGSRGFIWIPYELNFLNGAYSLTFPAQDTEPELVAEYAIVDHDGNWRSSAVPNANWYDICDVEVPNVSGKLKLKPVINGYAAASNRYVRAFDAGDLLNRDFPAITFSIISGAGVETPEGEIEFSLYAHPDDGSPALIEKSIPVWGHFPYQRKVSISPLEEQPFMPAFKVKYGGTAVADLNGDGADEFVVGYLEGTAEGGINSGAKRFMVARNNGSGSYTFEPLPGDGEHCGQPRFVDLNNDGNLDLIHSSSVRTDILFNDGSGNFSLSSETLPAGGMGGGVAVADFDCDGRPDLLLANMDEGLLLMRQLPDGSFEKKPLGRFPPYADLGVDSTCVATGDINGDGLPDFVFWEETREGWAPEKLVVGINQGDFEFSYRILPTPDGLRSVSFTLGDFDQDGCDDLAWSGSGYTEGSYSRTSHFGVFRGSPDGWMHAVPIAPEVKPIAGGSLAWIDLNADGVLELIVTGRENDIPSVFPVITPTLEKANQGFYRTHCYVLHYDNGYFVESGFNLTGVTGSHRGGLLVPLDMDGDDDLDLLSAGYRGPVSSTGSSTINETLYFTAIYENSFNAFTAAGAQPTPPTAPTTFSATPAANQMLFAWSGATGGETAPDGLRYLLQVGTASGNYNLMSGTLDPQNRGLLQKDSAVLADVPAGTLFWRVRTLDSTHNLSPWSAEQMVTMPSALARSRISIAAVAGGISVPGAGEHLVAAGGTLQLAAQAAAGWQFDGWLVDNTPVSGNPYALTPSAPRVNVVPQFSEKPGTVPEVGEWSSEIVPSTHPWYRFGFTDFAAVTLNNHLYCFPGFGASGETWRKAAGGDWQYHGFMGGIALPYADAVAWNNQIWLVSEATVYSATQASNGALTWSTKTTSAPWGSSVNMELAAFNNKLWATKGFDFFPDSSGSVWSSPDGITWTQETTAPWDDRYYKRLVVNGDTLLAILSTSERGTDPGEVWATTDGVNWTLRCAATPWEHDGLKGTRNCYIAAARFDNALHVVGQPNTHFISMDGGTSWTKVHPTGSESSHFTSNALHGELLAFDNTLYLIGDDYSAIWKLAPAASGGTTTYTFNISVDGVGGSTLPPAGVWFDEAGSYPVVARPEPGYEFVGWSGPVADPSAPSTSVQLDANVVVVATFQELGDNLAAPPAIPLGITIAPAGSGRVGQIGNPNLVRTQVLADGSTKIIAIAEPGWEFSHWIGSAATEILSATTAVIPAGAASVDLTACFRPLSTASVLARENSSGLIDAAGRQWLWGANRFGIHERMWNSPDGGLSPFAFNAVDFYDGITPVYELGSDGSLRQGGTLRFLEHRFIQVISAGSGDWRYTLAIDGDGAVWSWGNNAYGQLGDGTLMDRSAPVRVQLPAGETFIQVCAGETFGMALSLAGNVYVWGANSSGQTGAAGFINQIPVHLSGLPAVKDIAAGSEHGLALGSDGLVYGWGANTDGQSSGRRGEALDMPAAIAHLSATMPCQRVTIQLQDEHGNSLWDGGGSIVPNGSCFLRAYAEFFVAAENGERYLFDHWEGAVVEPERLQSTAKAMANTEVTAVFALKTAAPPKLNLSMSHTEAAMISPAPGTSVYERGERIELTTQPYAGWQFEYWIIDGQINPNATVELTMNRDVTSKAFYSKIEFRTKSVPDLLNSWGQPANYDPYSRSIVDPNYTGPLFVDAKKASFGTYTKLYLAADGTVWYLESVPDAMERVPGETVDIPYFTGVKQIVADSDFMLAVRSDNSIWVWGNLPGYAEVVERPIRAADLDAADYKQIIAVGKNLFFVHNNGTVSSWGTDISLSGTGVAHNSPTSIPGLSGIVELVGNAFSIQALNSNGTVWGWGSNYWEYLGVSSDTLDASDTPVQLPGLSSITKLFSGGFAHDTQGRVWVWGRDNGGSTGLGSDYAHQSIVPPMQHSSFPSNVVSVSQHGSYTSVLCSDGSIWRAGNARYWDFRRLNTEFRIVDTYETPPVHRQLIIDVDPAAAAWISHLPGAHRCMDNERVLLWADPPLTVQCDGWLIDGQLVGSSAVSLLMNNDRTAEPVFSPRPKIELPAPVLHVGSATVDQSSQGQVVRLPITLSGQDYVVPEALQFAVQVPGELPLPKLTVPDAWRGLLDVITETEVVGTNADWHVKVVMAATNNLFATTNMTLATLNFNLQDVASGDYPIRILDLAPVMMPVASDDDGAVAVPLTTADGALQLKTSQRCAVKLHLTPHPTTQSTLDDHEMESLTGYNALRTDLSRYAEVWIQGAPYQDLWSVAYNLAVSGSATFTTNQQYFVNEADLTVITSPDGRTLTSMGGPISDEKIITHNDFAPTPYTSGQWLLIARLPLGGSGGQSTISLTEVNVELFQDDGIEHLVLPDQMHELSVAPNSAPTSSNLSISTSSAEFVRIQPEIHEANPQDMHRVALIIRRHPTAGRVIIDPQNRFGFIYHPPENGIFTGTISFQFALTDGSAISETYTAEIIVNNPPRFVGIPDVIDCGSDTTLSLVLQASDLDTPPGQLTFSLHNAPSWMSISNQGDGTALISGSVPPTRDTWQIFAVQVNDPLSRATTQATLLLTFDPAVGGVLLTVVNGTGSGLFEAGVVQQISARNPQGSERFVGWAGDVQFLDNPQSPTPTVTLPGHDITLTALFSDGPLSSGFSDWADAHGLAEGQSGLTDSPAGDGISNLEKYALGLNPKQVYAPGSLFTMRIDAAEKRMILRYKKSKSATDAQITPVWSASLTDPDWRSTSIETTLIGETDTHQIWEAALSMTSNSGFMRLRFELQDQVTAFTFADWISTHALSIGEDGADDCPAGDGVSNLEKYAYGLNPRAATNPSTLFTMQLNAETDCFVLRFEKSKQATHVQITPVWTASLTEPHWRSDHFATTLVEETETHETWEASIRLSTAPQRFVRLRFTLR